MSINNAELIEILTESLEKKPLFRPVRLIALLTIAAALVLFCFVYFAFQLRTEWPLAAFAKVGFFSGLALLLWSALQANATPAPQQAAIGWTGFGVALAGALVLWHANAPRVDVFAFSGYPECVGFISAAGLLLYIVSRRLLRLARPATHYRRFGAALGAAAGMLVAAFYGLHCAQDSTLYLALAYVPPILFLAFIGALFPHPRWRW